MSDLLMVIDDVKPTRLIQITSVTVPPPSESQIIALKSCVASAICPLSGVCLDSVFGSARDYQELITFNFATVTNSEPYIDLWIGIQTDIELDGIYGMGVSRGISDNVLNRCQGIISPQAGREPSATYIGGQGGRAPPSMANVILYATPNTGRDLFKFYAAYVVERYRLRQLALDGDSGIITVGDFVPLGGTFRSTTTFSWAFAQNMIIASGVVLGVMVIAEQRVWALFTTRS
jgi:hypothetical protein